MLLKASRSGARVACSPVNRLVCGAAPRSAGARRPLSVPQQKADSKQLAGSALTSPAFGSIKRGMADTAAPPKAAAAPAVAEAEVTAATNPLLSVGGCMRVVATLILVDIPCYLVGKKGKVHSSVRYEPYPSLIQSNLTTQPPPYPSQPG